MSPKQTLRQLPRPRPTPCQSLAFSLLRTGGGGGKGVGVGGLQNGTDVRLTVPRPRLQPEVVAGQGLCSGDLVSFLLQSPHSQQR